MNCNIPLDLSCSKLMHPAKGVVTAPGAGKSTSIRQVINDVAQKPGTGVVVVFVPDLQLGNELLAELRRDLPHLNSELYLGLGQPDPGNMRFKMCKRHRVDELVALGVPVKSLCGSQKAGYCRHHFHTAQHPCGYSAQSMKRPDIWVCTHAMIFMKAPDFFGPIKLCVIDESFFRSAYRPNGSIDLDEIEDPTNYQTLSHLAVLAPHIAHHIRAMNDGPIEMSVLSGFVDNQLVHALDTVNRVSINIPSSATDAEIDDAIAMFHGSRSYAISMFWSLLAQSNPFKVGLSPSLFKVTEDGRAVIDMKHMSYPDPTWQAPVVLLDSTMPIQINRKFFSNLKVAQVHTKSSFTKYVQITDSLLSRTQFRRSPNTYDRVIEIIQVAASQIPSHHPVKVLIACSKRVENELHRLGLPPGCETIHYGAVTGSNKYTSVPCIIAVGRIEIPVAEAEQQAAILNGTALGPLSQQFPKRQLTVKNHVVTATYHPDPVTEEIRQHWNESQLLQAIGRGRAIRRTIKTPLDVILLTSVPLPIEPQHLTQTSWKDIQATALEVILADNGIVPLSTGELMRHHSAQFGTKDKARTALKQLFAKFPDLDPKTKVGGISSIRYINRRYPTYFHKTTALIRYTPDFRGAKPVYALIRKMPGKSLQDTMDELTPTKSQSATSVSYEIRGFILREPKPLPNKLDNKQYFDEQDQKWVLTPKSNTTDECGVDNGRAYYRTERSLVP